VYIILMSDDDADRFRRQAQECVQQAERSISPLDKETSLRVAAEWIATSSIRR
jgi:hypothetical protein